MTFMNIMRWLMGACIIIAASQRSVGWLVFAITLVAFCELLHYLFNCVSNRELPHYHE